MGLGWGLFIWGGGEMGVVIREDPTTKIQSKVAKFNTSIGLSAVELELQYPGFRAAWSTPRK